MPAIVAQDVRKAYRVGDGQVEILHGVSLAVHTGEMVAVMGPSGSGKSTLLYCLAGLEAPTAGEVVLAGQPLSRLSRTALARMRRSQVGFVFQSYNLIPTLTAEENVTLPYTLGRTRPPSGLVTQTLVSVGLADRAGARPPSMSGGEQQRVALARVLAQQPEVIFADEPTGALDTRTGELVLAELARIAHAPGRCVLVVTHDPRVAAACDRVLFMSDGQLVRELRGAPAGEVAAVLASLGADREG
ncbi:MAG: ABC transporter ATP-binding protein [Propionibacteriaceae bacterium]|nr:ABC transporter ATP-binding protein [Propionibacteriaceae bacterium]